MSIFSRVLIACIAPLIVMFAVMTISINNMVYERFAGFADEKTMNLAAETAKRINGEFENVMGLIDVAAAYIEGIDPASPGAGDVMVDWMRSILKATPYIHCMWVSFEPGEFGTEERYSRDLVKTGDSITLVVNANPEEYDVSPWYQMAFTTGQKWLESADYYDFGLGEGGKYNGSVSMPLTRGGKTVGVVGMDMFYKNTFRFIAERQERGKQLVLVMTQDGEIIYAPDSSLLTKSIFDMNFAKSESLQKFLAVKDAANGRSGRPFSNKEFIQESLTKERMFTVTDISPFFDARSMIYFYPITSIDFKSKQLYLYVDLPADEFLREAKSITSTIVLTSIVSFAIFALILFFTIRGILRPVKKLTESVKKVASGDFDLDYDFLFNMEMDVLKKRSKNEIDELFLSLKNMQEWIIRSEKLKAMSKAKSDFLAKMSHEIRTPMNAITGMAELALREDMSPAAQEHVFTIKQAGANLLSIVNDILDLSKIESGKLEIVPAEYQVSSLINDVVSIIRMRVMNSVVRFVVNADCNIPSKLYGDEIRIRQILLNFLSNAVKYTPEGFISLDMKREPGEDDDTVMLNFEISDSGKGIKEEDVKKLFSEFVRVDKQKNKGIEGTGLGLVISKNLVEAMGGEIGVKSVYGKGSVFTVKLPQKIRSSEPLAAVKSPERKSVLIFERREICAVSVERTLKNLGVACTIARDADELYGELSVRDYSFVFVNSSQLSAVKNVLLKVNSAAEIVLLNNFGDAIIDKSLSVLAMPAHSVSVANILNGVSGSTYGSGDSAAVRFSAPGVRVLVVDDINTNLKVAAGLLLPYKMQVDLSTNGPDAIEKVKLNDYDLIFMDHMMPGMDGIETVKHIRELGARDARFSTMPIIALTANAVSGTKEMFLANGFNDYLSKPIDIIKLNTVLETWIPRDKRRAAASMDDDDDAVNIVIDGIDTRLGLSRTGGKADGYLQTLAVFRKDGARIIDEIKNSLQADDLQSFTTCVHGLKSAAANIGAAELSNEAGELEEAGKRGDRAFIESYTPHLLTYVERILRNIDKVAASPKDSAPITIADNETLAVALAALISALNDLDPGAIKAAVKDLRPFESAAEVGPAVEDILQKVLNGEYDEAMEAIAAITPTQTASPE